MRYGKIARLPHAIREQVNQRLENNELGQTILDWLNALPEVRQILTAQFDGQPISKQNLSGWRHAGFRTWQTQRESLKHVPEILSEAANLEAATGTPLGDTISTWCAVHELMTVRTILASEEGDNSSNLKMLRGLLRDSSTLQRGSYRTARLKFEDKRLSLFDERNAIKKIKLYGYLQELDLKTPAYAPRSQSVKMSQGMSQ